MNLNSPADLHGLWDERQLYFGEPHRMIDVMVDVYEGRLPAEFDDYFPAEMHVHLINMIRLAWDDLANLAGKEFPLYVEPDNDTPTAKARAEKQEKIGYGWNTAGRITGGISMNMLMKVLAWWLVGTANAVAMVLPSYDKNTPYFTFRDPRTHYPPVGWSPFTQASADDALFAYTMTVAELKTRYPDRESEIANAVRQMSVGVYSMNGKDEETTTVWVGEYYHKDCWMVAMLDPKVIVLARSDTGDRGHPDVMPVQSFSLYSASHAKGRSIFADQVSIQAAMARMFSQKLDYFDHTLYPMIFHTPLTGKMIRIGPYATNEFAMEGSQHPPRLDVVAPQNPVDADSTIQFAIGLSRMLNRNPESMQGSGDADSAKAINELKAGVNQTIRDGLWPPLIEGLPSLYSKAAQMDVKLWGSMEKRAIGKRKNSAFSVNYRPRVALLNREDDFQVEPGLGLAGYQGTLEIMQLVGAELLPEDDALEMLEGIKEPQEAKRRLQAGRLEKLSMASLEAKAVQGLVRDGAIAEIRRRVQQGEDMNDVIEQLEAAGRLYVAPPTPMGPGAPAEDPLAAMMGGGMPPPTLGAIRGA